MAQATFHFPRGFLWGTATAAHQVEGNNIHSDWWAWEQQPGRIIGGHKSGLACDWWGGRWREDFDRAADGGQNAHRLSIEWARIQPTPDRWDESALDRYLEMLRGLQERGILPLITLQHVTLPQWVQGKGGWENPQIADWFVIYCRRAVEALRDYCSMWITINEPNVWAPMGYALGVAPPGKQDTNAALEAMYNMIRAHAQAYRAIHALQPQARVGVALQWRGFNPARRWLPLDGLVAGIQNMIVNELFPSALFKGVLPFPLSNKRFPEAKGTQDFLGLNYYTREQVAFDPSRASELFGRRFFKAGSELSSTGFIAYDPAGIYEMVKWGLQFNLPILITENGVEDPDDRLRPRYLIAHLHQLWRAVNFNFPVKGYFHWTLVDNFEWERGWTQRFGLYELDETNQTRRKRPSADLYAAICRENGISSELVALYAPELFETLFPN